MSVYQVGIMKIAARVGKKLALCALLTMAALTVAHAQLAPGYTVIQGFVMADRPVAVTRTTVTAIRVGSRPLEHSTVPVNSTGFYRFEGLTPGRYQLCVQSLDAVFVDPCQWGGVPTVDLNAGDRLPSVPIAVRRGKLLKIFVDGAGPVIDRAPLATKAELVVGVRTDQARELRSAYHFATVGDTREYRLAVPVGLPLKLEVQSRQLRIQDPVGRDFGALQRTMRADENDASTYEFRFAVAGLIPGGGR